MQSMTLGKFRNETNHLPDNVLVFINVGHPEDASEDIVDTATWEVHGAEENPLNEGYATMHISLFVPIDEAKCAWCGTGTIVDGDDCCAECIPFQKENDNA